jgi:hypothetical protein
MRGRNASQGAYRDLKWDVDLLCSGSRWEDFDNSSQLIQMGAFETQTWMRAMQGRLEFFSEVLVIGGWETAGCRGTVEVSLVNLSTAHHEAPGARPSGPFRD